MPTLFTESPKDIAKCAQECLESLHLCHQRASRIHPREGSLVEDQIARFSLWTAGIGVFATDRGSLDHRLRQAQEARNAVKGLLEVLEYRAKSCTLALDSIFIHEGPNDSSAELEGKLTFEQSLRDIKDEISLLHKFSNTIRRASKVVQDERAAKVFRIRDDNGDDAEEHLHELFVHLIRDRFPGIREYLLERLAATMLLRRKRILYRRSRCRKAPSRPAYWPPISDARMPEEAKFTPSVIKKPTKVRVWREDESNFKKQSNETQSMKDSTAQTATTLRVESYKREMSPSIVSGSGTVPLNCHEELRFPPSPWAGIIRRYHKAHPEENLNKHLKAQADTVCPYCCLTLHAQDVAEDKNWRLHVMNDLDSYVCLFESCQSPNHLYSHSNEWIKHMRLHTLRWRCKTKSHGTFVAETKDEYRRHMKETHPGKMSDARLEVMVDRNARSTGAVFKYCPLCGIKDAGEDGLENHVIGHMRHLALLSIPRSGEGVETPTDCETDDDVSAEDSTVRSLDDEKAHSETHEYHFPDTSAGRGFWQRPGANNNEPEACLECGPEYGPRNFDDGIRLDGATEVTMRNFEWGFIPHFQAVQDYSDYDPILQDILNKLQECQRPIIELDGLSVKSENTEPLGSHFGEKAVGRDQGFDLLLRSSDWMKRQFIDVHPIFRNIEARESIRIAVLDTGCSFNAPHFDEHLEDRKRIIWRDFVDPLNHDSWVDEESGETGLGHGSLIVSLLLNLTPSAEIYVCRTLTTRWDGTEAETQDRTIDAIRWASEHQVNIVIIPFHMGDKGSKLSRTITEASNATRGILFFSPACDEVSKSEGFPATMREHIISVRAVDTDGCPIVEENPAPMDSSDAPLLFSTFGGRVACDWKGYENMGNDVWDNTLIGCPAATPILAATAALFLQYALNMRAWIQRQGQSTRWDLSDLNKKSFMESLFCLIGKKKEALWYVKPEDLFNKLKSDPSGLSDIILRALGGPEDISSG